MVDMKKEQSKNKLDRIAEYLHDDSGEVQIDDQDFELLDKLDFVDNQIRSLGPAKARPIIEKKFNCGKAQAYRYINQTKELFASISTHEKDYWRRVVIQMGFDAFNFALKKKDARAMAMVHRNLIKATGADREDPNLPSIENFEHHVINIVFDPEILGVDKIKDREKLMQKYLNKLKDDDVEDAEYTEDE